MLLSCEMPYSSVLGVKGSPVSNPAVPTGSQIFSNTFMTSQELAKSHLLVNGPSRGVCRAHVTHVLPGHLPRRQSQASQPVKGSKIARVADAPPGDPVARVGVMADSGGRRPLGGNRRRWRLRRSGQAGWQAATATPRRQG